MKILVVGSNGRFGTSLLKLFNDMGVEADGVDISDTDLLERRIPESDYVFLSVPISPALDLIKRWGSSHKLIEVSSVKGPFRKYKNEIISIHPLFGPLSIGDNELRNILFITDISIEGSMGRLSTIFPGFNILPVTSRDHDQLMLQLQVLPYLISMISARISLNTTIKTRSRVKMDQMIEVSSAQSPIVLHDTIRLNEFSRKTFDDIRSALNELEGEIFDSDPK